MSNEELLVGVNSKSERAWEGLYEGFYAALCSYSQGIVGRADVAQDIVQELLVGLWSAERHFGSMPELTFFLYKATYNNSLYRLRTRKTREGILAAMEPPELDDAAFAATIREELLRKLHVQIAQLPAQRQRIVMLSLGGHSREEIAQMLEISPNTVKAQKTSALKTLREALKGSPLVFFL